LEEFVVFGWRRVAAVAETAAVAAACKTSSEATSYY